MTKEPTAAKLRTKAAKYRALARASNDDATAYKKFMQAAELEKQARKLDPRKGHAVVPTA